MVQGHTKIFKAGVAILISDKIDFREEEFLKTKKDII